MQVIIFQRDGGKVSVVFPAPEYADQIEAVAARDVPAGRTWRIVDEGSLPFEFDMESWRWTDSGPLTVV